MRNGGSVIRFAEETLISVEPREQIAILDPREFSAFCCNVSEEGVAYNLQKPKT